MMKFPKRRARSEKLWIKVFFKKEKETQSTELLLLPTLILKVSSLLILNSSKDSFQSLSIYIIWSSEPRAQQLGIKVPTAGREGCLSLLACSIPVCDSHWGIPEAGHGAPWLSIYTEKSYHLALFCRATRWCPVSARYNTLDAFHPTLRGWEGSSRQCVLCWALGSGVGSTKKPWRQRRHEFEVSTHTFYEDPTTKCMFEDGWYK